MAHLWGLGTILLGMALVAVIGGSANGWTDDGCGVHAKPGECIRDMDGDDYGAGFVFSPIDNSPTPSPVPMKVIHPRDAYVSSVPPFDDWHGKESKGYDMSATRARKPLYPRGEFFSLSDAVRGAGGVQAGIARATVQSGSVEPISHDAAAAHAAWSARSKPWSLPLLGGGSPNSREAGHRAIAEIRRLFDDVEVPAEWREPLLAIAMAECGMRPLCIGQTTPDFGLWQINLRFWSPLFEKYDWRDPVGNLRMAVHVYEQQGWGAWVAWKGSIEATHRYACEHKIFLAACDM